ncbi:hypothetical protein SJAG_04026 [Schizosaccharomyces japonicus yFS275]|uniref:Uncharacterized protein n=1 Tax=Schizosaccharomyces japonicus (strain yFS275 / FY16936) TaxID=402676 RepID=B6K5Q1_SCHJY|nr:hypothetical protein SJAG_04026 [Schizosaccharomyces japonicus yFS275]EEB08855.1 hypothetical protein SJAG_04026 [Schizosaccharomyces japonicus yFS275]
MNAEPLSVNSARKEFQDFVETRKEPLLSQNATVKTTTVNSSAPVTTVRPTGKTPTKCCVIA